MERYRKLGLSQVTICAETGKTKKNNAFKNNYKFITLHESTQMDTDVQGKEFCEMSVRELGQLVGLTSPSLRKTLAGNALTTTLYLQQILGKWPFKINVSPRM